MNLYPTSSGLEQMEALDTIENRTVERYYYNFLKSQGDIRYRFVNTGNWTIDLKERIAMLSADKDNSQMYRIVFRGTSHERARPQNSRFGGGSITNLTKTGIAWKSGEANWLGLSWKKKFNKNKLPSLNQIQNGLIDEAMVQLK